MKVSYVRVVLVLLMMVMVTPLYAMASGFTDVDDHWAESDIRKLNDLGIIDGYTDGSFKPDGTITRAEFITLLVRALKKDQVDGFLFEDGYLQWSNGYLLAAVGSGIINQDDYYDMDSYSFLFEPDKLISREEMSVFITRGMNKLYESLEASELSFVDSESISVENRGVVKIASDYGIIMGYSDGSFAPQKYATRAEACVMINRMLKNKENEKVSNNDMEASIVGISSIKDKINVISTGVAVGSSNMVLVPYSVVDGVEEIEVVSNGKKYKVLGVSNYNQGKDLCILITEELPETIVPIRTFRNPEPKEDLISVYWNDGSIEMGTLIAGEYNFHTSQVRLTTLGLEEKEKVLFDKDGNLIGLTISDYYELGETSDIMPASEIIQMLDMDDVQTKDLIPVEKASEAYTGNMNSYNLSSIFAKDRYLQIGKKIKRSYTKDDETYFGYRLSFSHEPGLKNNVIYPNVVLRDINGKYLFDKDVMMVLSNEGRTQVTELFPLEKISDYDEGLYTLEFVLNTRTKYKIDITIHPNEGATEDVFSDVKIMPISSKVYDDSSSLAKAEENIFIQSLVEKMTYAVWGSVKEVMDEDRNRLLTIKEIDTNGDEKNTHVVVIIPGGQKEFFAVVNTDRIAGHQKFTYTLGKYDVDLLYGNNKLAETEFEIMFMDVRDILKVDKEKFSYPKAISIDEYFSARAEYTYNEGQEDILVGHDIRIRSSNTNTEPYDYVEIHLVNSMQDERYTFNGIHLTAELKGDVIEGEQIFMAFYANENLMNSVELNVTVPEINCNYYDAFMTIAPNQEYDWIHRRYDGYEALKVWETDAYKLSDENYMYVVVSYDSDYQNRLGYLGARLINEDTGEVVMTYQEAFVQYKDNKAVMKVARSDEVESLTTGKYRFEVETEPNGAILLLSDELLPIQTTN